MIPLNQEWITPILLAVVFSSALGVILIARWLYVNGPTSKKEKRISRFVAPTQVDRQGTDAKGAGLLSEEEIGKFRAWINSTLSGLSSEKLQVQLSSAYWPITDTEYILIRILGTALALTLGWLILGNILGGIFLAVLAVLVPPILLDRSIVRRQKKFHEQLLDVLVLIKGAVQAGYSLQQALDVAVDEVPPPASEEFGRVLQEIRLGVSLEDALFNLAERMESDDLQIVVTAIVINAQVGGNLSTVLEAVISTIRDRMQLQGEIRSLTAYAIYVGNFLSLLPFITGLVIFFITPDYFDTVGTSLLTQIMFLMALVGIVIGNIWIRKIVKIKV